jgi:hypothetical protein
MTIAEIAAIIATITLDDFRALCALPEAEQVEALAALGLTLEEFEAWGADWSDEPDDPEPEDDSWGLDEWDDC